MARLELTGKRYGRLTVIKEVEQIGKYRMWLCQCECGNTIMVKQENLRSNNTRSCGCLKTEYYKSMFKDLSDQRFGKLVAEKAVGKRNNSILWLCQCDCGNTVTVTQNQLSSGNNKSCGCQIRKGISTDEIMDRLIDVYKEQGEITQYKLKKQTRVQEGSIRAHFNGRKLDDAWDLVRKEIEVRESEKRKPKIKHGDKFGRLTVMHNTGKKENGKIVWLCRCRCGNEVEVRTSYLTSGETRSCGCIKKEQDYKNLRQAYDKKRVNGVAKQLFKGKEPRKDSSTGFRGVSKYYTRKSKELRYRAWITVKGKRYYKSGFKTPEDAYYNGRLVLEKEHLPEKKG